MQRAPAKKSPIEPIHALAAAVLAAGALFVSAPAFAAPNGEASTAPTAAPTATPTAAPTSNFILVQGRSGNGNRGGGKGRGASHLFKQGGSPDDIDWRRDDRGHAEDRHDDLGRAEDRRHDRGHAEGHHDHGNHYGWERGNHYGWDRNGGDRDLDARRFGDRPDWRAERRHSRWTGQDIGRVDSSVLLDYEAYDLPRPGPGQYYARSGDDVYLVTERTRQIMDAFMLRGLVR